LSFRKDLLPMCSSDLLHDSNHCPPLLIFTHDIV
jgi:hypothetical protein